MLFVLQSLQNELNSAFAAAIAAPLASAAIPAPVATPVPAAVFAAPVATITPPVRVRSAVLTAVKPRTKRVAKKCVLRSKLLANALHRVRALTGLQRSTDTPRAVPRKASTRARHLAAAERQVLEYSGKHGHPVCMCLNTTCM